jgi:hypothetical protein
MGNSYRVRIGLKEIQAMEPNTILWDLEVKGFVARRQFSEVGDLQRGLPHAGRDPEMAEVGALPNFYATHCATGRPSVSFELRH